MLAERTSFYLESGHKIEVSIVHTRDSVSFLLFFKTAQEGNVCSATSS